MIFMSAATASCCALCSDVGIVPCEGSSCYSHEEDVLPKIAMPTLAQFIAERDLSVDALAVLGEIDPSTAYRIVTGQSRPRPVTVVRLARADRKSTRLNS